MEERGIGHKTYLRKLRAEPVAECDVRVRPMNEVDLEHILELRTVVRWAADPRSFELLRGVRDARWAVAETSDGRLVGMVGAVPLGAIGILCHLAVHDGYRKLGLGARLSSWAVAYLRSRGAKTVRLYSTRRAEKLYGSLGFEAATPRTVYRLDEASLTASSRARQEDGGYGVETLLFGDLPELYGLDRWSYGADRSALLFATLRMHPGQGLVARDSSGRIKGYLMRSAEGSATRIGPFVAESGVVARLLLARAILDDAGPVVITVSGPEEGPAHDLLQEFGLVGRSDRLRMELGEKTLGHCSGLTHYATTPYLAT